MNTISSEEFSYEKVDYIIECDGGILKKENIAGIAWVIRDFTTKIPIAEGRAITGKQTTTIEAELLAMTTAIIELEKMDCKNVVIKTDYNGFIKHLNNQNNTCISKLKPIKQYLNKFDNWCIKNVDREDVNRPHKLASSIDKEINYTPIIE